MKTTILKTATVLTLTTFLTSCASMGFDDHTSTQMEGGLMGAGLGAALGGLIGGRDGALWGAGLGAGVGFLVGNEVASRKQSYATQEALIAGETQRVANLVQELENTNAILRQDIASYNSQISSLKSRMQRDSSAKEKLRQQKATVDKRYQQAKKGLKSVENELKTAETLHADTKKLSAGKNKNELKSWENRINSLRSQKVKLENNTQQLQAVSNAISL
jgi:outer membrane lipoprotein SlyB